MDAADHAPAPRRRLAVSRTVLAWILGLASGLAAVGIGAVVVIEAGLFDATASTPHVPVIAVATHTAMIRSVQVRAPRARAPIRFSPAQVSAGFADYDGACVACHGAPGVGRADWAAGMTPTPPYLVDAARHWSAGQLYWIVGQGVKMTGMPAWTQTRSNAQLWNLVAFLEALPYLTAPDYQRLRATAKSRGTGATPAAGSPPTGASRAGFS